MRGVIITGLPVLGLMLLVHQPFMATLEQLPHFQSLVYSIFAISQSACAPAIQGTFVIVGNGATSKYISTVGHSGAFYGWGNGYQDAYTTSGNNNQTSHPGFDAARCSSVYSSNNNTLRPLSRTCMYLVRY